MTRRIFSIATIGGTLFLGLALSAHAATSQGVSDKMDDFTFEAFARGAAYHCADKVFADKFARDSRRYVKAVYPADAEKRIAGASVSSKVVAIGRAECAGLVSQMKDLQRAREEELKALADTTKKFAKAGK